LKSCQGKQPLSVATLRFDEGACAAADVEKARQIKKAAVVEIRVIENPVAISNEAQSWSSCYWLRKPGKSKCRLHIS
jgi:hypothetical protein